MLPLLIMDSETFIIYHIVSLTALNLIASHLHCRFVSLVGWLTELKVQNIFFHVCFFVKYVDYSASNLFLKL
uniref:Uncharacterized protein n=1 Tax=Arundo donax TaxID=35708 RepID=A0A0A9D9W4_ARUDO